jgi:hypothetical protein
MQTPESHFRLLRLAILRGLGVEQTGPDVFTVGSYSHPRHAHTVNPVEGSCCCPAFGWCCHLALAFDRWMEREADAETRGDYFGARRLDFGGLHRRDDLKGDDKRFVKVCAERAREKYAHLFVNREREAVSF